MKKINILFSPLLFLTPLLSFADTNIISNQKGNLTIGGNIEFNVNYQDKDYNDGDKEFNQDGRVLVDLEGNKYLKNGHFVKIKAQPLFESTGNVNLDDAYFEFGEIDGWIIKVGRYESYDMFPVGLDVFLEYSGDTSNELYLDGSAYSYQMKEGRGRGSDGQLMYYEDFGNLYFELGAMLGDRSGLFADSNGSKRYHGENIIETKDSVLIRPVIAYKVNNIKLALSMETNLVKNAIVDENGTDISDRLGYGFTTNWENDNLSINFNMAYMDAVEESNFSTGINAVWKKFGLGYVYSYNKYDDDNWADGSVNLSTIYTSYRFDNMLEIEDFSILLGAYYTTASNDLDTQSINADFEEDSDYGFRVRFFYSF
ncbi:carbohydrate porin [Vibrio rumoiensis]|uniref:Carbohydrate porin n=1 Tax=Vibrio rumoiensis TaxID=76258 RepID=A0ABW7J2M5_9VIBR